MTKLDYLSLIASVAIMVGIIMYLELVRAFNGEKTVNKHLTILGVCVMIVAICNFIKG